MHEPDWAASVQRYRGRLLAGRIAAGAAPDALAMSTDLLAERPPDGAAADPHALAVRLYMLWNYD